MNKKEIFNHYSEILDSMLDNSAWFDAFFQNPANFDESLIPEEDLPSDVALYCGATRTCVVDNNYDWVVKFDIEADDDGFACEREVNIYSAAKAQHLDQYFCEIQYIGTYTRTIDFYDIIDLERYTNLYCQDKEEFYADLDRNINNIDKRQIKISLPLYACPRALDYKFIIKHMDDTQRQEINRIGSPLRSRNPRIAAEFIANYGFNEYKNFSTFGLEREINDIHSGNIGSINGHMVLIDYAGYHYDEDCDDKEWTYGTDED